MDSSQTVRPISFWLKTGICIAAVAVFIYLFRFCWSAVFGSPDTCWILAAGRWIIQHSALPTKDVYSWTCQNQSWVLYQWLFELIQALLLNSGGLWLVGLVAYALVGFLLGFILPRWWLRLGVPAWLTFAVLNLALNQVWFYVRPQLASFFLLAAFLAILEYNRKKPGTSALWGMPPLMVLWANLHSFWFMGLIAILCYLAFDKNSNRKALATVFTITTVCVLLNPYGWRLVDYNLSFLREPDFQSISELQSPFFFHDLQSYLFLAYMVVCWIALAVRYREVPRAGLIVSAIVSIAALRFARFMPIAILGTWPYLGLALRNVDWDQLIFKSATARTSPEPASELSPRWLVPAHAAIAVAIPVVLWGVLVPNEAAALQALTYQRAAGLKFILDHQPPDERLYNDETTGSQLLFLGSRKVFIDNRFDVYGKPFCDAWRIANTAGAGWQAYLERFGVNAAAIASDQPLYNELAKDPRWLIAYDDGHIGYWLRDSSEHRQLLDDWKVSPRTLMQSSVPSNVKSRMAAELFASNLAQGQTFLRGKNYSAALERFQSAEQLNPNSADAHHWLIHTLAEAGQREQLSAELRAARPFFWQFPGEKPGKDTAERKGEQAQKIDAWVTKSTNELMHKYHP